MSNFDTLLRELTAPERENARARWSSLTGVVASIGANGATVSMLGGETRPLPYYGGGTLAVGDTVMVAVRGTTARHIEGGGSLAASSPGEAGADGRDGVDGEDGQDGQDGQDGRSATIAIGTVTTGAPGSSAQVTNRGTNVDAIWDVQIPRGDKGEQGDAGTGGSGGASNSTLINVARGRRYTTSVAPSSSYADSGSDPLYVIAPGSSTPTAVASAGMELTDGLRSSTAAFSNAMMSGYQYVGTVTSAAFVVDLEVSASTIRRLSLSGYYGTSGIYVPGGLALAWSDDSTTWTTVATRTVTAQGQPGARLYRLDLDAPATPTAHRYWRVTVTWGPDAIASGPGSWFFVDELELWGAPPAVTAVSYAAPVVGQGPSAPTSGTYAEGDLWRNTAPKPGTNVGWVYCLAGTSTAAGWYPYGSIGTSQ